jgi:ketosteroid isomerase-like protein
MSMLAPDEVVRLLFEARAAGDVRQVLALVDPEVEAAMGPGDGDLIHGVVALGQYFAREAADGPRVEVDAHRLECDGAGGVRVYGRRRVIGHGTLADSPAAWHITVRDGRVTTLLPLNAEQPALHPAA